MSLTKQQKNSIIDSDQIAYKRNGIVFGTHARGIEILRVDDVINVWAWYEPTRTIGPWQIKVSEFLTQLNIKPE